MLTTLTLAFLRDWETFLSVELLRKLEPLSLYGFLGDRLGVPLPIPL